MNQQQSLQPIFLVPFICCQKPGHESNCIRWLDLNQQYRSQNSRLLCEDCERQENQDIYDYDVIWNLLYEEFHNTKLLSILFQELENVIKTLSQNIDSIKTQIELFINKFSFTHPQLNNFLYAKSFNKHFELLKISEQLSREIIKENNQVLLKSSFHEMKYKKEIKDIKQYITALSKCSHSISRIQKQFNLQDDKLKIHKCIDVVQTIKYDLLLNTKISNSVTAIHFNWLPYWQFAAIALTNQDDSNEIQIWLMPDGIVNHQCIKGLKEKIVILEGFEMHSFISVDQNQEIRFWIKGDCHDDKFFLRRVYKADISCIYCLKFNPFMKQMAIGGDHLQLWELTNFRNYEISSFAKSNQQEDRENRILCLNYSTNGKTLISGNSQGKIMVLKYVNNNEGWKHSNTLSINTASIFALKFTSLNDDFISISQDSTYAKWNYDSELEEYEYSYEKKACINQVFYWREIEMILPVQSIIDGDQVLEKQIESDYYQFKGEFYLASVKNNELSIYRSQKS